jgi:hypothetical protein
MPEGVAGRARVRMPPPRDPLRSRERPRYVRPRFRRARLAQIRSASPGSTVSDQSDDSDAQSEAGRWSVQTDDVVLLQRQRRTRGWPTHLQSGRRRRRRDRAADARALVASARKHGQRKLGACRVQPSADNLLALSRLGQRAEAGRLPSQCGMEEDVTEWGRVYITKDHPKTRFATGLYVRHGPGASHGLGRRQ